MVLKRFGVSIPEDLLERFDELVEKRGYVGRSEAIRDAMREFLNVAEQETEGKCDLATLSVVYRHKPSLMTKMVDAQHSSNAEVVSTIHTHLSKTHCMEVMTIRGELEEVQSLANKISGLTGVEYSKLFVYSLPDDACQPHNH
jgi:CopG family nickel-responsive transcriptional regulator